MRGVCVAASPSDPLHSHFHVPPDLPPGPYAHRFPPPQKKKEEEEEVMILCKGFKYVWLPRSW